MADSKLWRKSPDTSSRGKRSVPLTPSNVMGAVEEVMTWWGMWGLAGWLRIPQSKQDEIEYNFPEVMEQNKQMISYWINTDPLAGWRRLIRALDWMGETQLADLIRSNAEPLTDATLTPRAASLAVSTVRNFWYGGLLAWLGVPGPVLSQITASQLYASEDEKRMAGLQYYLQTVPGASWGRIASALWWMEEQTALETVRQYLPHKPDPSLTPYNLTSALLSLPDEKWWVFGWHMDVPESTLGKIQSQFHSNEERKAAVIRVYLIEHPHPTWEHVSDVLYWLSGGDYHSVLERLQSLFPTDKTLTDKTHPAYIKDQDGDWICTSDPREFSKLRQLKADLWCGVTYAKRKAKSLRTFFGRTFLTGCTLVAAVIAIIVARCLIPPSEDLKLSIYKKPKLDLLQLIKYTDSNGDSATFRLIATIQNDCRALGTRLGIEKATIDGFDRRHNIITQEEKCENILDLWMKRGDGEYEVTWAGLVQALEDIQLKGVAQELKRALTKAVVR